MAPWWARQLAVFGSLSPSTASGKVLFIRDIGEWNSITTPATLDHLLGHGHRPAHRDPDRRAGRRASSSTRPWSAAFVLAPLMIVGGWARRRSADFGPFFVYAAILFAFSALVSAVHVPGGTFIHSASRSRRTAYILALEGVVVVVAWIAARRPAWDADAAPRGLRRRGHRVRGRLRAVAGSLVVHADVGGPRDQRSAVAQRARRGRRARRPTG